MARVLQVVSFACLRVPRGSGVEIYVDVKVEIRRCSRYLQHLPMALVEEPIPSISTGGVGFRAAADRDTMTVRGFSPLSFRHTAIGTWRSFSSVQTFDLNRIMERLE